nr:hypothetical protein [Tanacetum cinerariifolium]
MKRIIKEQVKGHVKEQVSRILPRIKQSMNAQLKAEVLTRNLYNALVEAYEADTIILKTYGETVTLKKRRNDEDEKDEGPSAGSDRGSKRQREEEPVQTTFQIKEPSHPKPPTPDHDWNKTLPAVQGSTQTWISELAKQADTRSSFNELLDTPLDFSNFIMNRLRVDTLTPELLAGPTYELMKGSCTSL